MTRHKILITGTSGRLGAALALALKDHHEIVQLDLLEPANPEQRTIGPVYTGSIVDPAICAEAIDGVDTVIHCAAIPGAREPYHELLETNVLGTFNLLEEAGNRKEVEQFVYISSIMMHGVTEFPEGKHRLAYLPVNEQHPARPLNYYGCTKVQAEYWCEKYVERFRKPLVVVRPPHIVRLGDEPSFHARPAFDHPLLYEYIGTTDLIGAIVQAMDYDPQDGLDRFLLHAPDQWSTTPSLELVERFFSDVPVDRDRLAACDGFGAFVDCSHAAEKLGWTPAFRCKR